MHALPSPNGVYLSNDPLGSRHFNDSFLPHLSCAHSSPMDLSSISCPPRYGSIQLKSSQQSTLLAFTLYPSTHFVSIYSSCVHPSNVPIHTLFHPVSIISAVHLSIHPYPIHFLLILHPSVSYPSTQPVLYIHFPPLYSFIQPLIVYPSFSQSVFMHASCIHLIVHPSIQYLSFCSFYPLHVYLASNHPSTYSSIQPSSLSLLSVV